MHNPLAKILQNIGKVGGGEEGSAVGVDIGTSSIKIVEIRKKGGKALLETYGAIALGPYNDEDAGKVTNLSIVKIAEALLEVLKQSGSAGNTAAFAIPVQSSLIFVLELPSSIKESEIPTIVSTEARKFIPVPITEVTLDYYVLPHREPSFEEINKEDGGKKEGEKMNVLVVATQNDAISRFRSIVSESKMTAAFFEIEIFSSIRANFEHELSPVLLLDLGASRTKLSVVEFGMVKSYHTIDRGGADITNAIAASLGIPFAEAEKKKKEYGLLATGAEKNIADIIKVNLDYIFAEANNALLSYERKYSRAISKVIFSGGGALLRGLTEAASENFKAEIEIGHPFGKVGAPEFLNKVLESMGPEFAVALGLALRKLQ